MKRLYTGFIIIFSIFFLHTAQAKCLIPAGKFYGNWNKHVAYESLIKAEIVTTELRILYPSKDSEAQILWYINFTPEGGSTQRFNLNQSGNVLCEGTTLILRELSVLEQEQANMSWSMQAVTWHKILTLKAADKALKPLLEMNYNATLKNFQSSQKQSRFIIKNNGIGGFVSLSQKDALFTIYKALH